MQTNAPTRAVARSGRAMLASPHAQATAAGVDVLRAGGNAVDAAIAANAVLSVVYPTSCGLGGDAFWLVYEPRTRRNRRLQRKRRRRRGARRRRAARIAATRTCPSAARFPVTVPGAVRSWEDVLRAHGTRGLDELLAPAEAFARDGFVATDVVGRLLRT